MYGSAALSRGRKCFKLGVLCVSGYRSFMVCVPNLANDGKNQGRTDGGVSDRKRRHLFCWLHLVLFYDSLCGKEDQRGPKVLAGADLDVLLPECFDEPLASSLLPGLIRMFLRQQMKSWETALVLSADNVQLTVRQGH